MTDCKAVITTTDLDGITASRTYADLQVPEGTKLITLDVEIPARLKDLKIIFSGEIESVTKKQKIPLFSLHSINVNSNVENKIIYAAFLRFGKQGYQIELRGRGGEPLPRQVCNLALNHVDWKKEATDILMTDELGIVYLGDLTGITTVKLETNIHQQRQTYGWNVANYKSKIQYPEEINLCEGDEFGVPVDLETGEINYKQINLITTKNDSYVDSFNSKLSYDSNSSML